MQGRYVSLTFGLFMYIFVLIGKPGFRYFLLSLLLAVGLFVLARGVSKYLKSIPLWQDLLSVERFILVDVLAIFILVLIPLIGLQERSAQPYLENGFRVAGLRLLTRMLGVAFIIWASKLLMGEGVIHRMGLPALELKKTADRQIVSYMMVFPAEIITILVAEKTLIQWLLQTVWLEFEYGIMWEFLILGIGLLLLLWGRMNLIRREQKIAARVQWK